MPLDFKEQPGHGAADSRREAAVSRNGLPSGASPGPGGGSLGAAALLCHGGVTSGTSGSGFDSYGNAGAFLESALSQTGFPLRNPYDQKQSELHADGPFVSAFVPAPHAGAPGAWGFSRTGSRKGTTPCGRPRRRQDAGLCGDGLKKVEPGGWKRCRSERKTFPNAVLW